MTRIKQFLSLLLVLCMVLTFVPATAWASETVAETVAETNEEKTEINLSADHSVNLLLNAEDVEIDEEDPIIISVAAELEGMKVLNAAGDPVPLTAQEKAQALGLFQQYLAHWDENVNLLGVQTPFFLSYNDNGEDGLGVLGEMLVMGGLSVDMVRAGYLTFDDLSGMIQNFYYADVLGISLYGDAIASARDAALKAVKDSGAKTMAQKLLVLTDWLAHYANYDVTYIMNSGKEEGEKPMIAENPQQHQYYTTVYDVIYNDYEANIRDSFESKIRAGLEPEFKSQYYTAAIEAVYESGVWTEGIKMVWTEVFTQQGMAEEEIEAAVAAQMEADAEAINADPYQYCADNFRQDNADQAKAMVDSEVESFMTTNADAIAADPAAFVEGAFGAEAAAQIAAGWEAFWADAQENGVEVDPENAPGYKMTVDEIVAQQMDTAMDDLGGMTPNQTISVYADQAASGLTQGVLDYWEGSHIGVLGAGYGVCLGYTKAFTYLVQYMNPEVYGTSATADMSDSANWKSREDLYYTDGALDIDKGYLVDTVRITYDADVRMFGEVEEGFNSDHFWNAVKVDGQWYYVDTCYVDVFGEVMDRSRVETDGYLNHLYFLFSHTTATELYSGNYSELKTLYADVAIDEGYEDAWFSRAKSNVYSDGSNFYYMYDSSDLATMIELFVSSLGGAVAVPNREYKLVSHQIIATDSKATAESVVGDTDYTTLIEFNHPLDPEDTESETVARVLDASGTLVENELLTALYAEHCEYVEKFPGIKITAALYNNKLYFNLSNCILSYDLATRDVVLVKEYNAVSGTRDKTNAFGGMAFTVVANGGDFTFGERPIAGLTIKADGKMYVAVATNLGFISGKSSAIDQTSYGYEYEETNYTPDHAYYSFGYSDMLDGSGIDISFITDDNDNDEFIWSANFVETLTMSHLDGSGHNYAPVTVAATCTENGYTENRCSTCGAIQADSRVESKTDLAHDHHYIRFDETYYTKNEEDGSTNTGSCYICTCCYKAVSEPAVPEEDDPYEDYGTSYEEQMELYENDLAEYNTIVASAGHTYTPVDAQLDIANGTLTFSKLETGCDCADRKNKVDHLLDFKGETVDLSRAITVEADLIERRGDCTNGGAIFVYAASGEVDGYNFAVTHELHKEDGAHSFRTTWNWTALEEGGYSVTADVVCEICDTAYAAQEATVTKNASSIEPTCTAGGVVIYDAAVVVGGVTLTDSKTVEIDKLNHTMKDGICIDCGAIFAAIIKQPEDVVVAEGDMAVVTVEAVGDGLTYEWYYKDANGTAFTKTDSFTGKTYKVTMNANRNGRQVYCVITDMYGNSVTTDTVTLSMRGVTVGGVNAEKTTSGDGWSYDPVTGVLTLDGFNCTYTVSDFAIYSNGVLTIELKGENVIDVSSDTYNNGAAIHAEKGLAIVGEDNASLTIYSDNKLAAIYTKGPLEITDCDDITLEAGFAGVISHGETLISDSKITANCNMTVEEVVEYYHTAAPDGEPTGGICTLADAMIYQSDLTVSDFPYGLYLAGKTSNVSESKLNITGAGSGVAANFVYFTDCPSIDVEAPYDVWKQYYDQGVQPLPAAIAAIAFFDGCSDVDLSGAELGMFSFGGLGELKNSNIRISAGGWGIFYPTKIENCYIECDIFWTEEEYAEKSLAGIARVAIDLWDGIEIVDQTFTDGQYAGIYTLPDGSTGYGVVNADGTPATHVLMLPASAQLAEIIQQPVDVSAANGETVTVTVEAIGDGLTYQWYVKNVGGTKFSKSSITKATYSVTMSDAVNGRQVYCVVTDQYGNEVRTDTVTLTMTMRTPLEITKQPENVSATSGEKAVVTLEATGDGLTYQWYVKNVGGTKFSKSSITKATYSVTMSDAVNGRQIYCVVTDQYGNKATTNTVTLSMRTPLKITKRPVSVSGAAGETVTVTVEAEGEGLTYEWHYKNAGGSRFTKTDAFTGNTYSVEMSATRDGRQLYCVITDKYGDKVQTDTVTLEMKAELVILEQPQNVTGANGTTVRTTVTATGDGLTYQWYIKNPTATKFAKSSVTGATYSCKMSDTTNGRQAYCIITDQYGNKVQTDTVTLTMRQELAITKQPVSVSGAVGETVTVTVEAEGDGLTYEWYYKNAGGSRFTKTDAFTGNTYSVEMSAARNGRQIYCVVTDQYGNKETTNTVTLSIKQNIEILEQPQNASAESGATVRTAVTASGDGLTYQWYIKNPGKSTFSKSSVTGATYSCKMSDSTNGRQAYCVITDQYGNKVQTDTVTLTMRQELKITKQPVSVSGAAGETVTVTVEAEGDGLTYEWYYKNASGKKFAKTDAFTGNTYTVEMSSSRNGRQIYCIVTDQYGNQETTNTVTISMN